MKRSFRTQLKIQLLFVPEIVLTWLLLPSILFSSSFYRYTTNPPSKSKSQTKIPSNLPRKTWDPLQYTSPSLVWDVNSEIKAIYYQTVINSYHVTSFIPFNKSWLKEQTPHIRTRRKMKEIQRILFLLGIGAQIMSLSAYDGLDWMWCTAL